MFFEPVGVVVREYFSFPSFVVLVSLCRASQVSCNWYHMASDHRLWMKLCRYGYNLVWNNLVWNNMVWKE